MYTEITYNAVEYDTVQFVTMWMWISPQSAHSQENFSVLKCIFHTNGHVYVIGRSSERGHSSEEYLTYRSTLTAKSVLVHFVNIKALMNCARVPREPST